MADMPDGLDNNGSEATGGGMLSQEALDALLAAATAEAGDGGFGDNWTENDEAAPGEPAAAAAGAGSMNGAHGLGGVVDLPSFDPPGPAPAVLSAGPEPSGITRVRDIPLEVTVELGRTRLLIKDILDLGTGSIIELDKIAGEPVELYANGLLIGRGEVIVIDDNFGVRVTEVITAADRNQAKDPHALAA